MRRSVVSGFVVALGMAGGLVILPGSTLGQDATSSPIAPGSAACTAEPRDIAELIPLWFDPSGAPVATPMGEPPVASVEDLPTGEPADAATVEAVNANWHEINACFAAGQYARAFSLMTDEAVAQFGPDVSNPDEDSPEEVQTALEGQLSGTPIPGEEPVPAEDVTTPELTDVRVLDDGRVGGLLNDTGDLVFLLFEQQDGEWLLAGYIDVEESGAEATPAA